MAFCWVLKAVGLFHRNCPEELLENPNTRKVNLLVAFLLLEVLLGLMMGAGRALGGCANSALAAECAGALGSAGAVVRGCNLNSK